MLSNYHSAHSSIFNSQNPTALHAWIYYGAPAQNAPDTYKKHKIDVLRPQYFNLLDDGSLQRIDEDPYDLYTTQNAFSEKNISELKMYSKEQLVTISGHVTGMRNAFAKRATNYTGIVDILVDFVNEHQLTGIDIDFESYNLWTKTDYTNYKHFISVLGSKLHKSSKKLAVCGPMWTSSHSPHQWKYIDFVNLPVDYITPMVYDYQWDYGAGQPTCPLAWLKRWILMMKKLFKNERLVIGLPSYGYTASLGQYNIKNLSLEQIKHLNGYHGGIRDNSSAEIIKVVGNTVYVSNDRESMNVKRKLVESLGATQVSVWHLGGNDWF
ncbi:glycoside hydrolase [Basidiobolus meristosporus CBS 931.73]|uniref:Chitinase domain-containing protein 1 n=1 Tax=Basidiobolus meristosporus CBS 931.73 TaxID=1314790 RepID=A0A1Y1YPG1_9FUNG|nr:glycoside hydrolase [Basidiobolus meristosporus CBS 931.73]|eukprot:ORX99868.1 glycoside hydrolase [Basidiobolus meristosporus CBS 931.73]